MTDENGWLASRIHAPVPFAFTLILGIFEGVDLASVGLAMSRMTSELALNAAEGGYCASASMLGLAVGAAFGGRLADICGRRLIMFVSIILLGAFSIASAHAWDFPSMLVARLGAGLGMGALMPILFALANAAAATRFRSTAIGLVMASGGVGSGLAAVVSLHPDWRTIFYFGGVGPIFMVPLMVFFLPKDVTDGERSHGDKDGTLSLYETLFGSGRLSGTLLIWILAFFISLVSYIMINWLPTLLVQKGATEAESHSAMILYSIGIIVGNIVSGAILDRRSPRTPYMIGYLGTSFCIAGLALGLGETWLYALAGATAFFIFGAQLVTFSLTPVHYPASVRATGIGAMVSAGRSGSVVGPLLVGLLLHSGLSASAVLLGLIPVCVFSLVLGLVLVGVVSDAKTHAAQTNAA